MCRLKLVVVENLLGLSLFLILTVLLYAWSKPCSRSTPVCTECDALTLLRFPALNVDTIAGRLNTNNANIHELDNEKNGTGRIMPHNGCFL